MQVFTTHILSGRQCPINSRTRHSRTRQCRVPTAFCLLYSCFFFTTEAIALPPPEDRPEEILRTEIITEARSPIDGQPMTAAEYAQLQAQQPELWADRPDQTTGTSAFSATQHIINKLPIRYLLRRIFPF